MASTFPALTSSLKKVYGTSTGASGPGKRNLTRRKFASNISANQSQLLAGGIVLFPPGSVARRCSSDRFVVGRSSLAGAFVPSRCMVIRCLLSGSGHPAVLAPFAAPATLRLARSARRRVRERVEPDEPDQREQPYAWQDRNRRTKGDIQVLSRPHAAHVSGPSSTPSRTRRS